MPRKSDINIRIGADLKEFSSKMQNASRQMAKMGKKLTKVGKQMTVGISGPLALMGGFAVKSAADIETLKTSLKTALGGTEQQADSAFKALTKFASETPFQINEVAKSFITLKNMGLDPSMAALESYGNTAAAMGKPLNQMVEAVADAATGEFERLKEFGIKAASEGDRVKMTFKGVTTDIGKNAGEIETYLQGIGNTEFAGGIAAQSQTFNGVMSTLRDNISLAAASFGEMMLPALKKFSGILLKAANAVKEMNPNTKKMVLIFGGLIAAIGPVLMGVGALSALLPILGAGLAFITSPIGLVLVALAALAAAFVYIRDNTQAFKDRFLNIWANIKNGVLNAIQSVLKGINKLTGGLFDGAINKLENLKSTVNTNTTEFGSFGRAIKGSITDLTGISFGADKAAESIDGLGDSIGGAKTTAAAGPGSGAGTKKAEKRLWGVKGIPTLGGMMKDVQTLEVQFVETADIVESRWESMFGSMLVGMANFMDKANRIAGVVEQSFAAVDGVVATFSEKRSAELENEYEARRAAIDGIAGYEVDKTAMLEQLDREFADKRAKETRKQAKQAKAAAIFSGTINALSAFTKALATTANPIFAAAIGALGAAQVAGIASTPIPALAKGGLATAPTLAMVGDNPMAAVDPEVIAPLSKIKGMMNGGAAIMDVDIHGDVIRLTQARNSTLVNRFRF